MRGKIPNCGADGVVLVASTAGVLLARLIHLQTTITPPTLRLVGDMGERGGEHPFCGDRGGCIYNNKTFQHFSKLQD